MKSFKSISIAALPAVIYSSSSVSAFVPMTGTKTSLQDHSLSSNLSINRRINLPQQQNEIRTPFTTSPTQSEKASDLLSFCMSPLYALSVSGSSGEAILSEEHLEWQKKMEKDEEVQQIRVELIKKYLSMGKTREHAEREVDDFLSDPERCEKYLEMRRYAHQSSDLDIVYFIFAFFVGLCGPMLFNQ